MIELEVVKDVGGVVMKVIQQAYALYQAYRNRDDSRQRFAKYDATALFLCLKIRKQISCCVGDTALPCTAPIEALYLSRRRASRPLLRIAGVAVRHGRITWCLCS